MDLTNENIIHVKKNGIEYLQFRVLNDYGIINCFTTKVDGFDLNGRLSQEVLEHNYARLCECLDIKRNSIVRPKQTHTNVVERVDNLGIEFNEVDGLATDKKEISLVLAYADCTPILIYDPVKKAIANLHSGWTGTVKKIAQKGVLKMQEEYGSNPADLIICFGPCIKEDHFEVEDDVKEIFENEFNYLKRNEDIIKNGAQGKYFIDTTLINELMLEELGVKKENIYDSGICTVCNSDIIHSYRIDPKASGRNIALIALK